MRVATDARVARDQQIGDRLRDPRHAAVDHPHAIAFDVGDQHQRRGRGER